MSSDAPVLVRTPSTMCQPAGIACVLYPRHALVFVPSNNGRQPAAVCSAVNPDVPDVALALLADCVLLPIAVQAARARTSGDTVATRAAAAVNMALLSKNFSQTTQPGRYSRVRY